MGASRLAWSLLFCAALALRLWAGIDRLDMIWPDEHFQTLEPAGWVVFGHGFKTWEWQVGYRSWVVPAFFMPVLWACKQLGVLGGTALIQACRAWLGALSCILFISLNQLMKRLGVRPWARWVALAACVFSSAMILWSVATLSDVLGTLVLWLILPKYIELSERKRFGTCLLAGMLAGVLFPIRTQLILAGAGLFVASFLIIRSWKLLAALCLGYVLFVLLSGILDWVTWGQPFHVLIRQKRWALEAAEMSGISPWYDYFPRTWENLGSGIFVALGMALILALILRVKRRERVRGLFHAQDLYIYLPMLAMFIGHSLIGHKETRFLLPIFPGFYVLLACFLSRGFSNTPESWNWNVSQRKSFAFVVVIGIVVLTFCSYRITRAREVLYSRSDTSALESAIFEERPSRRECVLLIEHPVTWTRGELILGGTEELVEKKLKELTPDILGHCRYAIFPDSIRGEFEQRTRGNWVMLKVSQSGYCLFKRIAGS